MVHRGRNIKTLRHREGGSANVFEASAQIQLSHQGGGCGGGDDCGTDHEGIVPLEQERFKRFSFPVGSLKHLGYILSQFSAVFVNRFVE